MAPPSLLVLGLIASAASGFEFAAVYDTSAGNTLSFTLQVVNGAYAHDHMKIALLNAEAATEEALGALVNEGRQALNLACTEMDAGDTLTPQQATCYELHLDGTADSTFLIPTAGNPNLAIFAEHDLVEFERDDHYLAESDGHHITEAHIYVAPPPKPWGVAIGAALIVCACTLIGVAFLAPFVTRIYSRYPGTSTVVVNSFAAGALLAATFYLILMEATHLVWNTAIPAADREGEAAGTWGSMVLAGFLTAPLLDLIISLLVKKPTEAAHSATSMPTISEPKTDDSGLESGSSQVQVVDRSHTLTLTLTFHPHPQSSVLSPRPSSLHPPPSTLHRPPSTLTLTAHPHRPPSPPTLTLTAHRPPTVHPHRPPSTLTVHPRSRRSIGPTGRACCAASCWAISCTTSVTGSS